MTSYVEHPRSIMTMNVIQPAGLTVHVAVRMFRAFADRMRRQRTIRALRQLDDHLLTDIGLLRSEIVPAARRPGRVLYGMGPRESWREWE
jgi:uncharacterized protein YjiS (DUF1127 family)